MYFSLYILLLTVFSFFLNITGIITITTVYITLKHTLAYYYLMSG